MKKLIFTLFALFALVCSLKSEVDFKIAFDETSDSPAAHQEPILSTKYAPLEAINISDENFEKTFLGARDEYLVVVYVNGSFYVLDSHFNEMNLTRHFKNNEWKTMEPRPEYLAPFSPAGKAISMLATSANKAISLIEDMKKEYSSTTVYGILLAIPIILLFMILLLTKKTKNAPTSSTSVPSRNKFANSTSSPEPTLKKNQ